jgi:Domain of unknown function (DUF389)
MHEIRVTLPLECISEATRLARESGIDRVSITDTLVNDVARCQFSVETSTPNARAFVEKFMNSESLTQCDHTLTSREIRSIIGSPAPSMVTLTRPMSEPLPDIVQDLWQLSHLTPSYIGRATAGAVLLADGLIHNSAISIVVGALVLPFLSQILAVSFGLWAGEYRLAVHGLRALLVSTALAFAAGASVAWIEGGPLLFNGFRNLMGNFLISAIIGTAAGLSITDDAGRRYLIGVAAAVQFAVFPVWFGAGVVLGLPGLDITRERLFGFLVNLGAISGAAMLAYASMHFRKVR